MTAPTRRNSRRPKTRPSPIQATHLSFVNAIGQLQTVVAPTEAAADGKQDCIPFDASFVPGLPAHSEGSLFLRPAREGTRRPGRLKERTTRIPCDLVTADGRPSDVCARDRLKKATTALATAGLSLEIAAELEFFLFARTEAEGEHTLDVATRYAQAPVDQAAAARKSIAAAVKDAGFALLAARAGGTAGRHRLQFQPLEACTLADDLPILRQVITQTAAESGLAASWMPRPMQGRPGAGMPLRMTLASLEGRPLCEPEAEDGLPPVACQFIAGLLHHARALCALTNPTVNSYKRLLRNDETPTHVAWSPRLRAAYVRASAGHQHGLHLDLAIADANLPAHHALAAMIHAGLDGIAHETPLQAAVHVGTDLIGSQTLPASLHEALLAFRDDSMLQRALGPTLAAAYLHEQQLQWASFAAHITDWELHRGLLGC